MIKKVILKDFKDFAQYYQKLKSIARSNAMSARTIKEARYHEGRASAFESVAQVFENMEEVS